MSEKDRQEVQKLGDVLRTLLLGVDPWTTAVPALLSDWTGYITVRPEAEQEPRRSHPFVAAWSGQWTKAAELSTGLENAVTFGVNALATALSLEKNSAPISLQRQSTERGTAWRISGRTWGEIAVDQTADGIRISTSAAELDRQHKARRDGSTPLMDAARDRFPDAAAFAWLHVRQMRQGHANATIRALLHDREPPPLFALNEFGVLFDELFAAVRFEETRISVRTGGWIAAEP